MRNYLLLFKKIGIGNKRNTQIILLCFFFLFVSISKAQMPFTTTPPAGSTSTATGTLGSGTVIKTVTPTTSGCYGYGIRYKNNENGFSVVNGACGATSTNPWT